MNERLKELAKQAGFQEYFLGSGYIARNTELECFAELVRADERQGCAEDYLKIMRDAVAREREACAKLCESMVVDEYATGKVDHNERAWTDHCAATIRARGEK